MISTILKKDHAALVRFHQAMKPEEKLVAFLNHSRLIHQLHQAGKIFRRQPSASNISKNTHSEK